MGQQMGGMMTTTRAVRYSRVESISYIIDEHDIKRAIRAYIAEMFKVDTQTGHWEFEWYETDGVDGPPGMLVVEMTQRFEHNTDGVSATLSDDQVPTEEIRENDALAS